MYSPKISEDLIPRIYRAAKAAKVPMTAWVNKAVERALPEAATTQPSSHVNGVIDPVNGRHFREMEGANGEH